MRPKWRSWPSLLIMFTLIFSPFILPAASTKAMEKSSDPWSLGRDKLLAFADHLFEKQEYYRSVTEYLRFLFLFPDDPLVKVIRLKIAYAYQRGEQWSEAQSMFEDLWREFDDQEIGCEAFFQSAETLRLKKSFPEAIDRFKKFIDLFPEDERVNDAFYRIGCLELQQRHWIKAQEALTKVTPQSRLFPQAEALAKEARELPLLSFKKPWLAGLLSAIVPGTGQVYSHRYRDGLTAFLVNAGFLWGAVEAFQKDQQALGGVVLFIEFGWYAGNIYSAANSAKKWNDRSLQKRLAPLLEQCSLSLQSHSPKTRLSGHGQAILPWASIALNLSW